MKTSSSANNTSLIEKVPPHNLEAEMAVLGAMLISEEAIATALENIDEGCFYKKEHRDIFQSIISLFDNKEKVDILTVSEDLSKKGILEKIGGASYLASLADFVPTAANVDEYAKIVKEKSVLRMLIDHATTIVGEAFRQDNDVSFLLDKAERLIYEISDKRAGGDYVHIKEIIKDGIETIEALYHKKSHITGVPSGFVDLDIKTAGFQKGDLIVVAGRPSMGKSAFATTIAMNVAIQHKIPVAILSLEMSQEQLTQRFLCSQAKVDANKVRTGFLSQSDWPLLTAAAGKLSQSPIYIDDTPTMNVFSLRAKARRMKAHHDIGLLIVDYLQLIHSARRAESRQQEISEISRALKALAKELNIPVLAVSQLSRAVEQAKDHRPQLSHLRESGAIEQDADVVIFLLRPEYYEPTEENSGKAIVIIAKQRNGPTGDIELGFIKEYASFVNLAKEEV